MPPRSSSKVKKKMVRRVASARRRPQRSTVSRTAATRRSSSASSGFHLFQRIANALRETERHKSILAIWATISVLIGFIMVLPTYVQEYNMGSTEVIYILLWNAVVESVLESLVWFVPAFFAILLYAFFMRLKNGDTHREFLTQSFKTKIVISAILAGIFSFIVYLDASNLVTSGIMMKPPYCPGKLIGETCLFSGVLMQFIFNIFVVIFVSSLCMLIALYGFYRGVRPTLTLRQK